MTDPATLCADLLEWFEHQQRDLPWRRTRDPYAVWLSEIMLQQTRVDTVVDYYNRFLVDYPTIEALAAAPIDDVLKRWEGLGYYARARNLHRAARRLTDEGQPLPRTRDGLLDLPGIGRYTAGAIASIAFGERVAAVDGNVERVLARYYADASSLWTRAQALADATPDPSSHTQALMEVGATVCTPRRPRCEACPLRKGCAGQAQPDLWPPKRARKPLPERDYCAAVVFDEDRFLIVKRPPDGLLGALWDLPSAPQAPHEKATTTCRRAVEATGTRVRVGRCLVSVEHVFTHFRMNLHAYACTVRGQAAEETPEHRWIEPAARGSFAFPNATRRVFEAVFEGRG